MNNRMSFLEKKAAYELARLKSSLRVRRASGLGRMIHFTSLFSFVFFVLLTAREGGAFPTGVQSSQFPNLSTACNGCHTDTTAATPDVVLTSDVSCIYTGASTFIHTTVTNSNGGGAGWNLRITGGGGTLSTGGPDMAGTRTIGNPVEITHSARKAAAADNLIHFSASYTAPLAPAAISLVVWGNAVNGNGNNQGDHANTDSLMLDVRAHNACGNACGAIPDACGDTLNCTCTAPNSCVNGQCVCVPNPNACGSRQCGTVDNGCGTQVTCGTCTVPAICSTEGQCACVPLPNPCAGFNCGVAPDGCGGVVSCGSPCTAPQVCGASTPNVCGCPAGAPLATCGTGACLRTGANCLASSCTPGTPGVEVCNGLDDDCDGVSDNDAPCTVGGICMAGMCVFPSIIDAGADADAEPAVADDASTLEASFVDVAPPADVGISVDAPGNGQNGEPLVEAGPSVDVGTGTSEAAPPNEAAPPSEAATPNEAAAPNDASSPPSVDDAMAADEPIQPGSTVEAGDDASPPQGTGGMKEAGASVPVDSAIASDGRTTDAKAPEASVPGAGGSGGDIPPDGPSGCSCRLGADRRPPAGWLLLVLGAALVRARRKRARPA